MSVNFLGRPDARSPQRSLTILPHPPRVPGNALQSAPDSVFIPVRQPGDSGSPWIKPAIPGTPYVGAGQSVSQPVHLGSYNIRVKVWPIRDGVAGMPAARDFPVCPPGEGNNQNASGQLSWGKFSNPKSPPGTNAVEGCAQ